MQTGKCFGISLIVFDKPSATCGPGEGSFDDPTPRQQDKAAFGFGQPDHFELDAFFGSGLRSCVAGVAPIDVSQVNAIARRLLYVGCKPGNSRAVTNIGRCHMQGKQVPQCIDCHVNFRPALSLGAVIAGTRPAFRRRPQGAAVYDSNRRIRFAARGNAKKGAQILSQGLETTGRKPALTLLIDHRPKRKVVRWD